MSKFPYRVFSDPALIKEPHVFVFASDLSGAPGSEQGRLARTLYRVAGDIIEGAYSGPGGDTYAIPVKDKFKVRALPLSAIDASLERLAFAIAEDPKRTYLITNLGRGLSQEGNRDVRALMRRRLLTNNLGDRCMFHDELVLYKFHKTYAV